MEREVSKDHQGISERQRERRVRRSAKGGGRKILENIRVPAATWSHTGTVDSHTAGPEPYVTSQAARGANLREAERQGGERIECAASINYRGPLQSRCAASSAP